MIQLTPDPSDANRLILTQTVTLLLDRVLVEQLSKDVEAAISRQAARDLKRNPKVQKAISEAAQKKLLELLGVKVDPAL